MAGLLVALTLLSRWAVLLLAQDTPQNCIFSLVSDGNILGQVEGGQVVGIPKVQDSSTETSGTIFRLRGGGLYDTGLRGCWWPVLVCSLQPPSYPDPLFALDTYGHLVYNATRRHFWACPAVVEPAGDVPRSSSSSYYYYLDPPRGMQRDGDGGGLVEFKGAGIPTKSKMQNVADVKTWQQAQLTKAPPALPKMGGWLSKSWSSWGKQKQQKQQVADFNELIAQGYLNLNLAPTREEFNSDDGWSPALYLNNEGDKDDGGGSLAWERGLGSNTRNRQSPW
ncbi:hypothetical protein B0I37DRAFT_421062 [Chaetomium sp. MPI-CAGE-AT-0009]|nr:hypothetical protein B0I37DRAFT_421062 [Chaetomium sp. MPI-CAGE-AT-0009]